MKRLAEFKNQKHITSVLRASIINGRPLSPVFLVGGDEEERSDLAAAYEKAAGCLSPFRGDFCDDCSRCADWAGFASRVQIETSELRSIDWPMKAEIFTLNRPDLTNGSAYIDGLLLVARILNNVPDGELIKAAKSYVTDHHPDCPIGSALVHPTLDILAKKNGVGILEESEAAAVLANRVHVRKLVALLHKLWEAARVETRLDPETAAALLVIELKYTVHPASDIAEPIISVDEAPISMEELERMANEV